MLVTNTAFTYMVNHVFLPPKLPEGDDWEASHSKALQSNIMACIEKFATYVTLGNRALMRSAASMIRRMTQAQNEHGYIHCDKLEQVLDEIGEKVSGEAVCINVVSQNAGVLIGRHQDSVYVESFELSPLNSAVMKSPGRLRRYFPGPAMAIELGAFRDREFQKSFAEVLHKLCHQSCPDTCPLVKKAGQLHEETRDTVDPVYVTEFMTAFLGPVTKHVDDITQGIWKNIRDEIMWHKSFMPWRRSPVWLLLRVSLQLLLGHEAASTSQARCLYKSLMLFFTASLLMDGLFHQDLSSDMIEIMRFKVARRKHKLLAAFQGEVEEQVISFADKAMTDAARELISRQRPFVANESPDNKLRRLESVNFVNDTVHRLKNLDEFIKSISDRTMSLDRASFCPPAYMSTFSKGSLPDLSGWSTFDIHGYTAFRLAEVEAWVSDHLDDWLSQAMISENACSELSDLITTYKRIATSVYKTNSEGRSIMVLVLIELWVVCDKIAIGQIPLLEQYDSCISAGLFESFLLPFRKQMARLNRVEEYLEKRCRAADQLLPCIFSSFGDPQSFAVRFYSQSTHHQNMLVEIESKAAKQRRAKIAELSKVQAEYRRLHNLFESESCRYVELLNKNGRPYTTHSPNCSRCSYQRQMKALNISIHEWPLPRRKIKAQATVFELCVPVPFSEWRDITTFILFNVLKCQYGTVSIGRQEQSLGTYPALSEFRAPSCADQRIGLESSTKPSARTHRVRKPVPNLEVDDVCVNNGLEYHYFDQSCSEYVTRIQVTQDLPQLCTFKLPPESKVLEKYLFRPSMCPAGPVPNAAIANQAECPPHLSIEEYKGLCSIVAGNKIQWQNILLQLAMPSVSFRRAETGCTVLQAMYQAGPPDRKKTTLRQSHSILGNAKFCAEFVVQLRLATRRIKQNWESAPALAVFISAATRILSLSSDAQVQDSCFEFLAEARQTAFDWLAKVRAKETCSANSGEPEMELKTRSAEIALICTATFDVEEPYFGRLLTDEESASILLQSCTAVQECLDHDKTNSPSDLRWKRLCHRAHRILSRLIVSGKSSALDRAIRSAWPAYSGGTGWNPVSHAAYYWLETATESVCGRSLAVHFNLLTAELLVNGSPLSRLPSDWEIHPTYRSLFGNQILDVMPSNVPGMRFSVKKAVSGYVLNLGLQSSGIGSEDEDFIISAKRLNAGPDASTYHLVPARVFRNKLPESFVTEQSHWYNDVRKSIEFCPKSSPWESLGLGTGWTLSPFDGDEWRLQTFNHQLLSPLSSTAEAVGACLQAIEDIEYMHLMLEESIGTLKIELPRLDLGFRLAPGSTGMQSVQFRGMQVDSDQSLGTLGGLASKLLLTSKSRANRAVIIPDGHVAWRESDRHVIVDIAKGSASRTHFYNTDMLLGRLQDNGSLRSKLKIAYLHGVTSFTIPDPLTSCTGTEQALSILQSSAVKSMSSNLSEEDVQLLGKISRLTPSRQFYPRDLCVMQEVTWLPGLSFLSQPSHYHVEVMGILEHAEVQSTFCTSSRTKERMRDSVKRLKEAQDLDSSLLLRDMVNTAWVRVSGFGAENFTTQRDRTYASRDWARFEPGEYDCFAMSSAIYSGEALMSWLSAMAFAARKARNPSIQDHGLLQVLLAFALVPEMAQIIPPSIHRFDVAEGYQFDENVSRAIIRDFLRGFGRLSELDTPRNLDETKEEYDERRRDRFEERQSEVVEDFIRSLRGQWPCRQPAIAPHLLDESVTKYIDIRSAGTIIAKQFHTWYDNLLFFRYLGAVAKLTASQRVVTFANIARPSSAVVPHNYDGVWEVYTTRGGFISVSKVFSQNQPLTAPFRSRHVLDMPETTKTASNKAHLPGGNFRIWELVKRLESQAVSDFQRRYATDLKGSIQALESRFAGPTAGLSGNDCALLKTELESYKATCIRHMNWLLSILEASIGIDGDPATQATRPLPRISGKFFISQLAADRWKLLPDAWKGPIVEYGLAIHQIQRAERLLALASPDRQHELTAELSDPGHSNWDPLELPLVLLMEIETNITIRAIQMCITKEIISPPGHQNASMQLNMGEGKLSVIVPAVAAILASLRESLVRVIVGKLQSKQMFQMFVARLGGLQNIVVHRLPFSRDFRLGIDDVATIYRYLKNCATTGGILLVQPEHIFSFKLMGFECLANSESVKMGQLLLETQGYFDRNSRDIVDENDENFSTKFELIYTMGIQRPLAFSPGRWLLLHYVLDMVRQVCPFLVHEMPRAIEYSDQHGPSLFPFIRILGGNETQYRLVCAVARQICQTGFAGVPIARQAKVSQEAIYIYLTEPKLSTEQITQVEDPERCSLWTDTIKNSLLLFRGFFAGGILGFVLGQKRWRVNYGLDLKRRPPTRLAVLYRAKDSPSPRSEFSHPKVIILLILFSYYYGGFGDQDLFHAFEHFLHFDQPNQEYQKWVRGVQDLSPAFQHLEGINIKDRFQITTQVFPSLRYSKAAVDYFLRNVMFPRFIKDFPSKLTASGWNLGAVKAHPTTGFSGTKDSRELLPLSVQHLDLKNQQHIDALVIEYLLQDETEVMLLPSREETETAANDAEQVLTAVVNAYPDVHVMLDVGAQILELNNLQMAKQWLEMNNQVAALGGTGHTKKQACVYLDDHDELRVVDLRGATELLQTSPYAQLLDQCLVFLDEAHTRGTDLKLPVYYRAAVTLGPALTKDRLIQACMRMRQLGKGQSILFCIPPEIQSKILQRRGPDRDSATTPIEVSEIIEWSIAETCIDLERCVGLWAVQGKRFAHQQHLWYEISGGSKLSEDGKKRQTKQWAEKFLEDEARTIQDLYRPGPRLPTLCCDRHADHNGVNLIEKHVAKFGRSADTSSATALQEEQERELSPEIQKEMQIQRPHLADPAEHSLDPEVVYFIRTGVVRKGAIPSAFSPAFSTLSCTTAAAHLTDMDEFPQNLLVTRDFARTIKTSGHEGRGSENKTDQFLRPVQWVVTSAGGRPNDGGGAVATTMVIISPFEAQNLISEFETKHRRVVLHLYAPRVLLGFRPLDGLRLYTTPALSDGWAVSPRLVLQLNLFSGQLYFNSFVEYTAVCDMLGLDWRGCAGKQEQSVSGVGADGFVNPVFRSTDHETGCTFRHSPVGFLKVFLSKVRRDSKGIDRTHIGKMLDAVLLTEKDFVN
ncbi:hypothetical protein MCOR30_010221 [Pyricularia oryzae]|nr:hypothetical protein MCOR30_010221 [Pyricularia oryzae]KAI6484996.1 hypothetical protein MCOR11_009846 [Pyricularia oryzae]